MAEKDNILRAKDIIPGRRTTSGDEGISSTDVPQFNLANDIMAQQRRLSAAHRKGPSLVMEDRRQMREDSNLYSYTSQWDPILADIVARDIEHLCKGGSRT